jgi:hypothetical protein
MLALGRIKILIATISLFMVETGQTAKTINFGQYLETTILLHNCIRRRRYRQIHIHSTFLHRQNQ